MKDTVIGKRRRHCWEKVAGLQCVVGSRWSWAKKLWWDLLLLKVAGPIAVICGCQSYWVERRSLVCGTWLGLDKAGVRMMALLALMVIGHESWLKMDGGYFDIVDGDSGWIEENNVLVLVVVVSWRKRKSFIVPFWYFLWLMTRV